LLALAGCTAPDDKAGGKRAGSGEHAETVDAHDTQEPDGGDSGEADGDDGDDSGTDTPAPTLEYARDCPASGFHMALDSYASATLGLPTKFQVQMDDIDYDGDGEVLASITIVEHSTPWLPAHLRVYESARPVVNGDAVVQLLSRFVGTFTAEVVLTSTDGGASEPWQCALSWHNGDRLRIELQVESDVASDIELHGLVDGAAPYSSKDATWCNEIVFGPDEDSDDDDIRYDGRPDWDHSRQAWVGTRAGTGMTVDAAIYARSVLAWDDEDRTVPHEVSVRAYSHDTLLFDERARLHESDLWTVGRVSLGDASSEAAHLDTLINDVTYAPPSYCSE
jgi:hypothetical protein